MSWRMKRIPEGVYLTQVFECGHCGRRVQETRQRGPGGRRGGWRRYCSAVCGREAKRLRDREHAQRSYRRRKGLCLSCGVKAVSQIANDSPPVCAAPECSHEVYALWTVVNGDV
jgi:hypothetical protein